MRFSGLLIFILMFMANSAHSACYNNCVTPPSCESMGYKLGSEISCPDGAILCPFDTRYKWCKEYKCEDGRYTETQNIGNEKGYKCDNITYHGNNCFDCYCSPDPSECKWTEKNKGQGNISDPCCDGTFAKCENTCADTVTVPEHAQAVKTSCKACGTTLDVTTDWTCLPHYDKYLEACYPHPCENDFSTAYPDVSRCGERGASGWDWSTNGMSGEEICGFCTPKTCLAGFGTDKQNASSCGSTLGWKYEQSNQYAGDEICGKCTCVAPSNCTWQKGNEGQGSLSGECCNGLYTTCQSSCVEDAAPAHATCNDHCTGCGNNVCTRWSCNNGWHQTNKTCTANECTGYATDAKGCGTTCHENGWNVNGETCQKGDTATYKCVKKNCPEGQSTEYNDVKKCGQEGGWTSAPSGSCNGDEKCYVCTKNTCGTGFVAGKANVNSCGTKGADGWDYQSSGYSGNDVCGKCTPKKCADGYDTSRKTTQTCGNGGSGWQVQKNGFSGDDDCTKCECAPKNECTWDKDNQGEGTLSELCCNGKYAVCTNTCGTAVSIPQHASCSDQCVSCKEKEICQAWACNQGFEKTTDGKGCCVRMKDPTDACVVGDVYYSNGKCGKADDYSSINCQGYIPVGVVYFVEGDYMRVIGLKDLTSNSTTWEFEPDKPFTNSSPRVAWGNYYTDIPTLTSYALESVTANTQNGAKVYPILRTLAFPLLLRARDHELFDGKTNTTLQSQSKSAYDKCLNGTIKKGTTDYPKYCQPSIGLAALSFCPPNVDCNDSRVGKGQWYVPAVGEWMELTGYEFDKFTEVRGSGTALGATKKVYQTVTATLTTLIKNGADAEKFIDQQYWTSNESSEQNGIIYKPDTGLIAMTLKSKLNTRLGLEIGCPKDALDSKPQHADEKFAEASKCTTKSGQTKYKTFECLDGYAKKGNTCVKGCAIGDVYYDDGTCGKVWNYDKNKTKTKNAVGVVFYVDENYQSGKVVNFRLLSTDENGTFNPDLPYNGKITDHTMFWGLYNTKLSSITFDENKLLEALKKKDAWVTDGKKNTSWILEQKATYCGNKTEGTEAYNQFCQASAAKAARDFYPPETTKDNAVAGAGKWHFASFGEMMLMFGYEPDQVTDATGTSGMTALVYAKLHSTMSALKNGLSVDARTMSPVKYFSSNRWNDQKPWTIDFSTGKRMKDYNDGGNMRPILDFTYKEQK